MKTRLAFYATLAAVGLLAGCANAPVAGSAAPAAPASLQAALGAVANFTVADLAKAETEAVGPAPNTAANPLDPYGAACYPALSKFVTSLQLPQAATVAGAFSAFEAGRLGVKGVNAGLPSYLVMGCAPLVQDVSNDVAGFLAKLAALGVKP